MSATRPPRWAQNLIIGLLVLCGLGLVIVPQIDIPHPLISNAEDSATKILSLDQQRRWVVTHSYGGLSSQYVEMPEIRVRADALPEGLQRTYYDGAAHHQKLDFDQLDTRLVEIAKHVPEKYQKLYYDGIMRLYTREYGQETQRVMDFAAELSETTDTKDLSNGIRIGLQQEFGDHMREAFQIALRYPTDLYYPLIEELGWRIGHDHGADPKYWREHASNLPENTLCWLSEGMTRGAMIPLLEKNEIWWPTILEFREAVASECIPEVASGIAEALLIILGDNPDTLVKQLDQVESAEERALLENILEQKQSVQGQQQMAPMPNADPNLPPL